MSPAKEQIELSRPISDEVKCTTCYMCACRCGIKVHLKDGRIRYIEGNRDHPVNKGVLCGKGSAGIMNHYSPARLSAPLLRVGPRGSGEFKEIGWDEAMGIAVDWLGKIRARNPRELALFTGRDQSQALTGWWAQQFGTPNYSAHGGFCSVNMAAAGLYTLGGSFWEFGEPDWERTRYFLMFGVAEDHDSNPIKIGLGKLKGRGAKFVSVNPVKTGYSAIADEWLGIDPGTDGLFVLSLVHELLQADRVDLDFLARYTNAPWLVVRNPGGADDGLFARDVAGHPLCWDRKGDRAMDANSPEASPVMAGEFTLPGGQARHHRLPAHGRALSRSPLLARSRGGGDRHSRRHDPARGRRAGPCRLRGGDHPRHPLDRLGRAAPRQDDRPARLHACHARDLGPFQRLPHLPRDPSAADAAGQHRLPRGLALQAALPAPHPAPCQADGGEPAGRFARRARAGLSHGAGGPSRGGGRHAAAHRQGL